MFINANLSELQKLAKYFYNITKTLISIYDENQNFLCAYPDTMCEFCAEIRKEPLLSRKCRENDRAAFRICGKTRKTYIYHCHMGLIEVATPIIYNNIIMGYMLFGQITDQKNKQNLILEIKKQLPFHLNFEELSVKINQTHYRSREYIESISSLLEMCANYIWLNSIISIRNEGIAYSINTYINEHLQEDLSINSLCEKFNFGRSTLYEIFKKNFGCSITSHVQCCRIHKAKVLLKSHNLNITQVAEQVGIPDTNYFIRIFKKQTGQTPKNYQTTIHFS